MESRLILKASILGLLLTALCCSARAATPLEPSKVVATLEALSERTTLSFVEAPLIGWSPGLGPNKLHRIGVLHYIADLHKIKFKLGPDVAHRPITFDTKTFDTNGMPLKDALLEIMKKCDCDYSIMPDGTILIQSNPAPKPEGTILLQANPSPKAEPAE